MILYFGSSCHKVQSTTVPCLNSLMFIFFTQADHRLPFSSSALGYPHIRSLSWVSLSHLFCHHSPRLFCGVWLRWPFTPRIHYRPCIMPKWPHARHWGNADHYVCTHSAIRLRHARWVRCLCDGITRSLSRCDRIFSRKWADIWWHIECVVYIHI